MLICIYFSIRSIKFNFNKNLDIIDAIWHLKTDDDWVVALTSDHNLKFFKVSNPNVHLKEFHFSSAILDPQSDDLKGLLECFLLFFSIFKKILIL